MQNIKQKIAEHYDVLSPYYHDLWGAHIHHGYWKTGKESPARAQEILLEELLKKARIPQGTTILDVGCGIGASTVFLAKKIGARVTGITISSQQVAMAREYAEKKRVDASFLCMDGEHITLTGPYDVVWSIEVISHYLNKENFFSSAARLLRPGGIVVLTDWLQKERVAAREAKKYVDPIKKAMLLPSICTPFEYCAYFQKYGLQLKYYEDISSHVSKTWDISARIIKNPKLWHLAATHGKDFSNFLKGFRAMQMGYRSGTFVYGAFVAEKV